ncbi:hypothetical protein GDO86_008347 [Hymenochirus boettgeri]|uniref:C2H2-type domain-containing protein n=1 Tax=Hymenochirus boettgeri TaxID=247094 RepID=A0A8T2J4L4_9PIPI|nr:hypothetical protein GDO86_008347 [Hymenochirus boettgeri]
MPKSFLVKKTCSSKIPNYAQLLETRQDVNTTCFNYTGLVLSMLHNDDSSTPSGLNIDVIKQWDTFPVLPQPLSDTGWKKQHDSASVLYTAYRMDNALPVLKTELPQNFNINNLNLPFRKRRDMISDCKINPYPTLKCETKQQADSIGCSDFQLPCVVLSTNKTRHCHGPALRLFSCQHCSKAYSSLGALKMHIRTHTLPCTCQICGKSFSRPWLLQGHIRTHTGEKPFSCFHCGRGFADRSNLRAHLQTHSEIKRYRCPGCGKTFSRISLLAKHRDSCCCLVS